MRACLLPARGDGASREVAGLHVAERTRRGLRHAGFELVPAVRAGDGAVLLVSDDAVLAPEAARRLALAAGDGGGAMAADGAIDAPAALALSADAAHAWSEGEAGAEAGGAEAGDAVLARAARRLEAEGRLRRVPLGDTVAERVHDAADARRLQQRLVADLVQPGDGFFARHFDRRLSRPLSVVFVRWGVTPNAVTLLATAVGLVAAACLATPWQALHVSGALLFVASTVLDGCDGEVARLSFTSSEFGRRLDLACDNVVNASVFVAIGWGALRADETGTTALLVQVTLAGFALATVAGFLFARWIERSGRSAEYRALYESLASRDFAYFLLLLALLDRLHAFVWFAAIGSWVFVVLLAVVRVRAGRRPPAQGWA